MKITDVGDTAFNVEFGEGIDRAVNARVMALHRAIGAARLSGLVETVPTFRSLLVSYDPLVVGRTEMETRVRSLLEENTAGEATEARHWRIPVRYDGDDLEEVCRLCGLSRESVISLHSGAEYFVYMLGFMPGFAYMGGLPEALRLPRKADPRLKVPAGSVAIAGEFSTVYPSESPGGWHLLGRTELTLFALDRDPPVLMRPGDIVTFQSVT